tara:strand:+ start:272 stop:574 length:303 start_codon:yes stop_codon:yes gene_type:complete
MIYTSHGMLSLTQCRFDMADVDHLDLMDLIPLEDVEWLPLQGATRTVGVSQYVNRVRTTVPTDQFVRWVTTSPDPAGANYPAGFGVFGVDTSDYVVETRR